MKEVELSDGTVVTVEETIKRKTQKKYNAAIYDGSRTNAKGEAVVTLENLDDANDVLVLDAIVKAKKGEDVLEVNQAFLDEMSENDFKKILDLVEGSRITVEAKKK